MLKHVLVLPLHMTNIFSGSRILDSIIFPPALEDSVPLSPWLQCYWGDGKCQFASGSFWVISFFTSHFWNPGLVHWNLTTTCLVFFCCVFLLFLLILSYSVGPFSLRICASLFLDNSQPSFLHMLLTSIHSILCFCKAIRWIDLPCLLTFAINFDQYGLWKNSFLDLLALSFTLQLYPFSFSSLLFTHF